MKEKKERENFLVLSSIISMLACSLAACTSPNNINPQSNQPSESTNPSKAPHQSTETIQAPDIQSTEANQPDIPSNNNDSPTGQPLQNTKEQSTPPNNLQDTKATNELQTYPFHWECNQDTCIYQYNNKEYTIPKPVHSKGYFDVKDKKNVSLSQIHKYLLTPNGWACASPMGCSCEDLTNCRYNSCDIITCSPGERCNSGSSDGEKRDIGSTVDSEDKGCTYIGGIQNVYQCETEPCECGTRQCDAGQICAYGHCFFDGYLVDDFKGCKLEIKHLDYFSGSTGTSDRILTYQCPNCPSDIPPTNDTYYYKHIGNGISDKLWITHIGLWTCQKDQGCICGNTICPKNTACIGGQCAIDTFKGYITTDNGIINDIIYALDRDKLEVMNLCATAYSEFLSYQPQSSQNYQLKTINNNSNSAWGCNETNTCICNGKKLPPNAICHRTQNGTEHILCDQYNTDNKAPQNIENYICQDKKWICPENNCICGNQKILPHTYCQNDKIYCGNNSAPSQITGYECDNENNQWVCNAETCLCDGNPLPTNAICQNDKMVCYGNSAPNQLAGYGCNKEKEGWVCNAETCLCGNTPLRPHATCQIDSDKIEKQCCGNDCFLPQTALEHECINGNWIVKAKDGQRHCQNKPLPLGTKCVTAWREEKALCGKYAIPNWDNYQCINNTWVCPPDKTCICNGKILPKNATCADGPVCGTTEIFEYKSYEDNAEDFICINNQWQRNPDNCYGHKLNKDVTCPAYPVTTKFHTNIIMSNMESCEHVRGCLCHNQLCPPSGICTENGCIDPLTHQPFKHKDGYLISANLQQCINQEGCKCGEETIKYRRFCFNDTPYQSIRSCISNNTRIFIENNFSTYECEENKVPYKNICFPQPNIDFSKYYVRECLSNHPSYFADVSVSRELENVCFKDECQCEDKTCKRGEVCKNGKCLKEHDDDTCHYFEDKCIVDLADECDYRLNDE